MEEHLPEGFNKAIHHGIEWVYGLAPIFEPTVVLGTCRNTTDELQWLIQEEKLIYRPSRNASFFYFLAFIRKRHGEPLPILFSY